MDEFQSDQRRGFSGLHMLACVAVAELAHRRCQLLVSAPLFTHRTSNRWHCRAIEQSTPARKLLKVELDPKELLPDAHARDIMLDDGES